MKTPFISKSLTLQTSYKTGWMSAHPMSALLFQGGLL